MTDIATNTCQGCSQEIDPGKLRCTECTKKYRATGNARAKTIDRDGYACARCFSWKNDLLLKHRDTGQLRFAPWKVRKVEVDHITPIALTGTHDPANLQVLCIPHHKKKTTQHDTPAIKGYKPSVTGAMRARWSLTALAALGAAGFVYFQRDDLNFRLLGLTVLAVLLLGGVAWWISNTRTKILARLTESLAQVTGASYTSRRQIKVHRWGRVGKRIVPTDFTLYYPHIFEDNDADKQTSLENRVTAKLGWPHHIARWDTANDRVRLTTPDPFVTDPPAQWPGPPESMWDRIFLGKDADGNDVTISLVEKNILVSGEPGSGKSVFMSILLAAAAADPNTQLWLADGKRLEFKVWEPCAERSVVHTEDFVEMLEDLQAIMEERYDLLADMDELKVERGDGLGLIFLAIDELAKYTARAEKKIRERVQELLEDIISRGRACGVIMAAATQRPSAEIVPTDLRDLYGYRCAFRATTNTSSDMGLGFGQASNGFSAAKIDPEARGAAYLLSESGTPRLFRAAFITKDERKTWARYGVSRRLAAREENLRERIEE